MVGQLDEALFAALAEQSKQRLGEFNSQNLANTKWAFAWNLNTAWNPFEAWNLNQSKCKKIILAKYPTTLFEQLLVKYSLRKRSDS